MSEHTKEPWRVMGPCAQWETARIFSGARYIGSIGNSDETESETRANADRIVSCVNACAGMEDPATDISALKAQRDELLAEVEEWRAIKAAYLIEYAARPNGFRPGQYRGHAHDIDGIWDRDNGTLAGCKCAACMMHQAAIANAEAAPCD